MQTVHLAGKAAVQWLREKLHARLDGGQPRGSAVVVEGVPGIGKTTLLERGLARPIDRDDGSGYGQDGGPLEPLVLRCTARPSDRIQAFAALVRALDDAGQNGFSTHAAEVAPSDRITRRSGRSSPLQTVPDERLVLVDGWVSHLEELAQRRPVLLALDDAQWADDATITVLERLVDSAGRVPITLVVSLRPLPRSRSLDALLIHLEDAGAARLVLEPLDDDEVAALLTERTGRRPAAGLVTHAGHAGGNPYLVVQLLGGLRRDGHLVERGEEIDVDPTLSLPTTARAIHRRVVSRMVGDDERTESLLRVAAAFGGPFRLAEVSAVMGTSETSLVPAVERLLELGVLVDEAPSLRFAHDLLAEAVLSSLSKAGRQALHRDIAAALRRAGAPASRIAQHLVDGAEHGDLLAVATIREAAASTVGTSPATASMLLRRALELCPHTTTLRDEIYADLVDALFWCGDMDDAIAAGNELLTRTLPNTLAARVHETMSRALALAGRPSEAIPHAVAMATASDRPAWATALTAFFRLFTLDLDGALSDARRAVEMADSDPWAETLALSVQCFTQIARGYQHDAARLGAAAVAAADRSPELDAHRLVPSLFHGLALENCSRRAESEGALRRCRALSDELGTVWSTPFEHFAAAIRHWGAGDWDEMMAECDAGITFGERHGITLAAGFAWALKAGVHLYRRELTEVEHCLDAGDALLAAGGLQYGTDWLVWMRAMLLEARGDETAAVELLRSALELADGLHAGAAVSLFGPDLVRIAVLRGEVDAARDHLGILEVREAGLDRSNLDARTTRARGLIELRPDLIAAAREQHGRLERPVEQLLDDEAAVLCAILSGRSADARRLLDDLLRKSDEMQCPAIGDRAQRFAAHHQITASRRRAVRAMYGWDALTATERHVVLLVAQGHSNARAAKELGISSRTVESHLYRTFAKLGVANRTELAVAAATKS